MRLIPPAYMKPFVKRQKNDAADAEAICEAAQRPSMRFVPVKAPACREPGTLRRSPAALFPVSATNRAILPVLWRTPVQVKEAEPLIGSGLPRISMAVRALEC